VSLAVLAINARAGGGLRGVWVASAALLAVNAAADAWLLSSPARSPVLGGVAGESKGQADSGGGADAAADAAKKDE
jgi:hypothetical protein